MVKLFKSLDRTEVLVIGGLLALAAVFCFVIYEAYKSNQNRFVEQKECYKDITQLIQKESSWKKVDWIKKTIDVERSAFGGMDYCRVLDLMRGALNGRDNDKPETSKAKKQKRNAKRRTHE